MRPGTLLYTAKLCLGRNAKKTNIALEHNTDLDLYEMLESGLRGGMCQVSHKHVKANKTDLPNYTEISCQVTLLI